MPSVPCEVTEKVPAVITSQHLMNPHSGPVGALPIHMRGGHVEAGEERVPLVGGHAGRGLWALGTGTLGRPE